MSGGTLLILALLFVSAYVAGMMQARTGYRYGYRFGYRQGYFDGDRASWNRRRRETQAVLETLASPPRPNSRAMGRGTTKHNGTTYHSSYALGRHLHPEHTRAEQSRTDPADQPRTDRAEQVPTGRPRGTDVD
ncbi:MAG TPA: hypothetical protein VF054_05070 [Micromonosporaceae bacterium]